MVVMSTRPAGGSLATASRGTSPHPAPGRGGRRLRSAPPDLTRLPSPLGDGATAPQSDALSAWDAGRDVLVHGAPGSGRTRLALTAALAAAWGAGDDTATTPGASPPMSGEVVLLAPRRGAATALTDAVARLGAAGDVRVSTPAGLAYSIVRQDAVSRGRGAPTLVTGPDQDTLLADLIEGIEEWAVPLDAATRRLPGFRTELRDVILRAGELGLGPDDLERLAVRRSRLAWADAARVQRLYLDVLDLEAFSALDAGERLDAGRLVRRAAEIMQRSEGPRIAALVVDDAQDLTVAGIELVRAARQAGSRMLLTSCPDEVVDAFRGAVADAARRIVADAPSTRPSRVTRRDLREVTLGETLRTPAAARPMIAHLRSRLPLAGAGVSARRPPATDPVTAPATDPAAVRGSAPAVSVLRAPGGVEEARQIAAVLRGLHHAESVPYDDMAIVCRSGSSVDDVADQLQRQGLPVTTAQRLRPLRSEPVVADLLSIVDLALEGRAPSAEDAEALLRGPFGDADALRLRRIRRLLLHAAPTDAPGTGTGGEEGAPPGSGELLARALVSVEEPAGLEDGERDRTTVPLRRVRRMVAAVRELGPRPAAADALWAAWSAARLAEGWREASLETDDLDAAGARGRMAGHRLDAVTSLFAAVERFTDRRPLADALVFSEHVRTQAVAEDSLAPRGQVGGRVRVLTPAAIAGESVDTVVLARVQEGSWPNTRIRSTLFGAAELPLVVEDPGLPVEPAAIRAVQRELVLADEIRLLVSALSRASRRILVTAVDDDESAPSAFLDVIERTGGTSWIDPADVAADPGPAPDPRRLVAALRRRLADPGSSAAQRGDAAALLARLDAAGAPGADPRAWYHQDPSSTGDLLDAGGVVALSPSSLERAHECPQSWLLERAGGRPGAGPAQSIGTAVHRIAQDHPAGSEDLTADGTPRDLLAELTSLLAPLHLDRLWSTRRLLTRAEHAVRLLSQHLQVTGLPLAVEAPFAVRRGDVELRGSIDRIEGDATGLRVVDLKTGRAPISVPAAAVDLQLAAYQTAVRDGALADVLGEDAPERLNGAQLVYVGTGGAKPAVRVQGALAAAEDPAWFDDLVDGVARDVRGSHVPARRNAHCDRCPVRRTCALWPEGQEL